MAACDMALDHQSMILGCLHLQVRLLAACLEKSTSAASWKLTSCRWWHVQCIWHSVIMLKTKFQVFKRWLQIRLLAAGTGKTLFRLWRGLCICYFYFFSNQQKQALFARVSSADPAAGGGHREGRLQPRAGGWGAAASGAGGAPGRQNRRRPQPATDCHRHVLFSRCQPNDAEAASRHTLSDVAPARSACVIKK